MKIRIIEKKIRAPAVWALGISIILSLATLVVYIVESDFSDRTLFFLLSLLRYFSFLVCICSLYLLVTGIFRFIRRQSVVIAIKIILFLCSAMYGAGLIIIDTFILSITGGNG